MAKHKKPVYHPRFGQPSGGRPDLRQMGLRAFHAGRFEQAIAIWTPLAANDPRVAAALAEAHFRRALVGPGVAEPLADLRRAVALAPRDLRYQYHLARALYRAGDLPAAVKQYRAVIAQNPAWPGAGLGLALATLEQDASADLSTLPGSTPAIRAALAPVQALLRGAPPAAEETPLGQLWYGLGQLQAGDQAAAATLEDSRPLPAAGAGAARRYYRGVALAHAGDRDAAVRFWQGLMDAGATGAPWLVDNLAAIRYTQLVAQRAAGDVPGALATAQSAHALAGSSPALAELLVQTLDEAARAAAGDGDWLHAIALWEGARDVIAASNGLGSPRPLLHNIAIAHETLENWVEAADAWRAMLRTRPRKGARAAESDLGEGQWAWVRRRVIECYKKAGEPGEAVTVFRQAIKADPDDLDLRLELAEALIANEQDQAASNELGRLLDIEPRHIGGLLLLARVQIARGENWLVKGTLGRIQEQEGLPDDVRRQTGLLYLELAQSVLEWGGLDIAAEALAAGETLLPGDYRFPLNQARIAVSRKQTARTRELLARALELGAEDADAYQQVIDCWAVAGKIEEVRTVLAQADERIPRSPVFYISVGLSLLRRNAPGPQLDPFGFAPARPAKPAADAWVTLATEMLQRAAALRPDDARLRDSIAADLLKIRPDLALPFAEEAARMQPDDPNALMMFGLLQGLNEQKREAKETLRRAGRLARQQGDMDLVHHIDELRHLVDSPMFELAFQLGPLLGDLDDDEDFF